MSEDRGSNSEESGESSVAKSTVPPIAIQPSPQSPSPAPAATPTPPSKVKRSFLVLILEILGSAAVIATIVGLTITVLEKWQETVATIDMGVVDQKKPFSAPFEISNPSGIFGMHSPAMACRFSAVFSDGLVVPEGGTTDWHRLPDAVIAPKRSALFFCAIQDEFTITNNATGKVAELVSATMSVAVKYETWIPRPVSREPPPTTFTLLKTSTGYRWIKGTLIK